MKLLFDQNISFRILKHLEIEFPGSGQVFDLQLTNNTDKEIWLFAKNNHYTIVTFDSDFLDLSTLFGHPPKILLLRMGNRRTTDLANIILAKKSTIQEFIQDPEFSCLEIE